MLVIFRFADEDAHAKDGCFQAHCLDVLTRLFPFPLSDCLRALAYGLGCFLFTSDLSTQSLCTNHGSRLMYNRDAEIV
jgi:hypothetical protein